jgi:pimeloyl-ACP methyl ester carboxylesterase
MARRRPLGRKLVRSLLPIVLVLALAFVAALTWIVHGVTRPPRRPYLVTPQSYTQISGPVLKATDETWRNRDGTQARGWLLRGAEGGPAVVLLHRYGADRSTLLNLGVKLNETSNFTILWPDLRGHGLNPPVNWTSFGAREGDDVLAALDYLRTVKTAKGQPLIGDHMGLYGIELGAYAGMRAAVRDPSVRVLALDSVPRSPDELAQAVVKEDFGLDNHFIRYLASRAVGLYLLGVYDNARTCDLAGSLRTQQVLLVSGEDAGYLRESTVSLAQCFANRANLQAKTDLPLTGFNLPWATGEQGEGYDRRVIDFFDKALRIPG